MEPKKKSTVIPDELRRGYIQATQELNESEPSLKYSIDKLENAMESFKEELDSADVKQIIDGLRNLEATSQAKFDAAIAKLKPIEEKIKKLIADTGGPIIWRDNAPQNNIMVTTYYIENGKIKTKDEIRPLKEDEKG